MLIPLGLTYIVLHEREERKDEAIANITKSWGEGQQVIGPVLIIPYTYSVEYHTGAANQDGPRIAGNQVLVQQRKDTAYFLPEYLEIDGTLNPTTRQYGIYKAVLYQASLKIKGDFAPPDFSVWKVKPDNVLWDEAIIAFYVADLRATPSTLSITFNNKEFPFQPGSRLNGYSSGIYAHIPGSVAPDNKLEFATTVELNGSKSLDLMPVGRHTMVNLKSIWPDPKFHGAYLPQTHTVTDEGFTANWSISYYGRSQPQQWNNTEDSKGLASYATAQSFFGISLLAPIDHYRLVERSIKYGILFLITVFTTFFIFETRSTIKLHPVQYTLVGAALVIFFLLLLALSELLSFGLAYTIGVIACTLLISAYSIFALKSKHRAAIIALTLALIYAMLYIILQLQDYALLLGTILIFAMLAAAMFTTRNIKWE